jgi:hypothetical protein
MTRPITPRPDRPAPTQPKPGTPSPTNPDGPSRPPGRPSFAHAVADTLALAAGIAHVTAVLLYDVATEICTARRERRIYAGRRA